MGWGKRGLKFSQGEWEFGRTKKAFGGCVPWPSKSGLASNQLALFTYLQ